MMKRHFSESAQGKLKNLNKDPTTFHVARCSPLHNSRPKASFLSNIHPKCEAPNMQPHTAEKKQRAFLHLISDPVLYFEMKSNTHSPLKFGGLVMFKFFRV